MVSSRSKLPSHRGRWLLLDYWPAAPGSNGIVDGILWIVPHLCKYRFGNLLCRLSNSCVFVSLTQKINKVFHLADPFRRQFSEFVEYVVHVAWHLHKRHFVRLLNYILRLICRNARKCIGTVIGFA